MNRMESKHCHPHPSPNHRRAFTRSDLLVTLTLLTFLLGFVLPALSTTGEKSAETLCASNLHLFGIAIHLFADDNDGTVMGTADIYGNGSSYYPSHCYFEPPIAACCIGGYNLKSINRYIEAYVLIPDASQPQGEFLQVAAPALCPAARPEYYASLANLCYQAYANNPIFPAGSRGHAKNAYNYFGRVDLWWESNTINDARYELTENELVSSRLLMSDALAFWNYPSFLDSSQWDYNHGRYGWSKVTGGSGSYEDVGEPEIAGINQLFGDGRVVWKPAAEMDVAGMADPATYGDGAVVWIGTSPLNENVITYY